MKHNKQEGKEDSAARGREQRGQGLSVLFAAVITRHTLLLFHACMHVYVHFCLESQL